jgi:3-hydroxyacyl-[acyl-carrier-protein] dehydratase
MSNLAEDLNMINYVSEEMTIGYQELLLLLPHRYPFLLIDRVEKVKLGSSAVGIKNVSANEWYFQGHFPERPILPGVLIIEAMAQSAMALVAKTIAVQNNTQPEKPSMVFFMSVEEAKFRKPVFPGDIMELRVTKDRSRGNIWRFKGEAWVANQLTDEATFTAMIAK